MANWIPKKLDFDVGPRFRKGKASFRKVDGVDVLARDVELLLESDAKAQPTEAKAGKCSRN